MSTESQFPRDAFDWTLQQALQHALDFVNGINDNDKPKPDGVVILFHYEDGPMGGDIGKRIYIQAGMTSTQIMNICNFANMKIASHLFNNPDPEELS